MTDEQSGRAEAEVGAEIAAETAAETAAPPDEAVERRTALVLAGLHLRLGSLALARAELETLAGLGALDAEGRIDLAEVRWRTGDLVGAGQAARESLAGGVEAVVALVVAAEAASALGRPTEARRLAGQALTLHEGPIDPIFAGMPRSSVWPSDPAEPVPSPATLFPPERADSIIEADLEGAAHTAADEREVLAVAEAEAATAAEAAATSVGPGLWDLQEAVAVAAPPEPSAPPELEPSALFDAGRTAMDAGDRPVAAVYLGLVVRLAPGLAPAVLSLIGEPSDAGLLLVQGDAYRAVGHASEATRAYTAARLAATTAARPEPPAEPETEAEPAIEPPAPPPETALWWLEPRLKAEPVSLVEPEREAEPSTASFDPPTEATGEPVEADSPAEPFASPAEPFASPADSPAEPFDVPVEPFDPPAEPDAPAGPFEAPVEPDAPTEPDAPGEPEPESLPESPAEFEPDREPSWGTDEGAWREDRAPEHRNGG